LIFLYRKRRDKIFFLSIWIVVTLLPVLVVPLNVLVNERRLYLPCAAFCIVLAFLGGNARSPQRRLGGQELGKVLGAIFLLSYGLLVFGRNQAWSDELSLWGDALTKSPAMPRVHVHLGNAWRGAGDPQRAGDAFIAALELDAAHRAARTNLANIYYEAAEGVADSNRARIYYGAAVREYEKVLSVDSTYVEALNGLGNAYRMLDDVHGAVSAYRRAIAVQPHFTQAHFNLASLLLDQGDYLKAVEVFRRLVSLGGDAAVYVGLGEAFFRQGKLSEAASAFQQACILDPGDPSHYYNWGIVLLRQGESAKGTQERQALWRQARVALQKVALLAPDYKQVESLLRQLAAEQL
jgi:tetratricopeptide (TPR) repeat protein